MISPAIDEARVRRLTAPDSEVLERMTPEELRVHLIALQELSEGILIHLRLPDLLEEILSRLCTTLGVDTAAVALSPSEGGPLTTCASEGFPEAKDDESREPDIIQLGEDLAGAVALRGEPVIVDDVTATDHSRARLRHLSSMMIAPLLVEGELLGILEVGSFEPRRFTDPQLYLLLVIADRSAAAIRNARLFDRSEERIREAARVEKALVDSESRHRILADTAADAIVTMDSRSVIITANPAAAEIFGYELDDLVGRSFGDLMPERLREAHFAGIQHYLRTGVKRLPWRGMVLPGLHRDGREVALDISFAEHVIDGKRLFTGTMRDITDRQRTERILAAQHGTTRVLAKALTVGAAIPSILQRITEALEWDAAGFWSWDDSIDALRPLDFWTVPALRAEEFLNTSRGMLLASGEGLPGRVWGSRSPLWIRDLYEDSELPRLSVAARLGLRSAFAFPVCVAGDCVGVMEFFTRELSETDASLLEAMDALGSDIGQFIRRREAEERLEEQEGVQRFLAQVSKSLSASAIDYEATLASLAQLAVPKLADLATVYVRRSDDTVDRMGIAHSDSGSDAIARELNGLPVDNDPERPAIKVMRTGEPLILPQINSELLDVAARDEPERKLLERLGIVSEMIVPLTARDRVLGSISLISTRPGRHFHEGDLAIALEFARRAGVALDNARLYREMDKANRAKAEFLATISHELRTPLNAVIGYADLLGMGVGGEDSERAGEYAERIGIAARHLSQLIEEVLAFSRLESGREVVSLEPVQLHDLFEEIRVIAEPLAQEKGVVLTVTSGDRDLVMWTDARKVRQILLNVVGNAIKFTDEGEVDVRWRREADDVLLQVRDTGVGIAPENQERIFEPFWQIEQGTTRLVGGTGLGLTVTRRFLDLLGGHIELESETGEGTTVRIRLPVKSEDGQETDQEGTPDV